MPCLNNYPLNETRILCKSIMNHNTGPAAGISIKYDLSQVVLKLKAGEEVGLTETGFR